MSYGTIKVDTITFTDNSVDKSVSLSGLIQNPTFTGNITVTGTISGDVIRGGTTVSGATVTGTTANFVSGVFTTQISGATVTGTTASFTSGVFTNISGTTATITSGIIASGTAAAPSLAILADLDTGLFSPGANQLAVATNGTGRLQIDSSGNIKVLTGTVFYDDGTRRWDIDTLGAARFNDSLIVGISSEKFRVTSGGLVGIGTSAPGYLIHARVSRTSGANATVLVLSDDVTGAQTSLFGTRIEGHSNSGTAKSAIGFEAFGGTNNDTGISFYTQATAGGLTRQMIIDSLGRVGIGTSSPTYFLQVKTNTAPNVNKKMLFLEEHTPTSGWSFNIDDNTTGSLFLNKVVTGTESTRITVTNSGAVGIGTTTPSDFNSSGNNLVISGTGNVGITIDGTSTTQSNIYFADGPTGSEAYRGYISYDHNTDSMRFGSAAVERARIDSSGRLLVGTSTARAFNTHNGSLQIDGDNYSESTVAIIANSNDADGAYLTFAKQRSGSSGGNTVVQNNDIIGELRFNAGDGTDCDSLAGLIACRVDGTPGNNDMPGRLVFSTTADGASSPTERMRIGNGGQISSYSATGWDGVSAAMQDAAGTTRSAFLGRYGATGTNTGTVSFAVYTNGNVQNTNNSYGAISDLKLKENIVDASSQWDDLRALQVRNYNFKEGQTHTQIGLVAQEAEIVSPGLVSESPDRDEDGNDLGTVTKSVNYSVLYMKAVKALQEAMERIETLEQRLNDAGIN
jgi:hypothetical protein